MKDKIESLIKQIESVPRHQFFGEVVAIRGLSIEASGLARTVSIGSLCKITARDGSNIYSEVVGFKNDVVLLMPFGDIEAIGVGCKVWLYSEYSTVYPDISWKGRVINGFADPIDKKGALTRGAIPYRLKNSPPPAHDRNMVEGKMDLGIRAINSFLTCCRGQRMGIFAGSGVGKSMLISMLTKYCEADIKVIGLIGERGREVQEFLNNYLGEEGIKNAVIIVATGDESALMRRQAAYLTLTVSEYYRDLGMNVLCVMDSVTRFAMAMREIGLTSGEPPTTKGYTPKVFAELPKLLERAGPGVNKGSITGIFSVLVEGGDNDEPISDAVRGILDGHIVLDRSIAERGRFPAINILRSVSRTMPHCNSDEENLLVNYARELIATYNDVAELVRLGAYKKGSDPKIDEAILYNEKIENFLRQKPNEASSLAESYQLLASIFKQQ